LKGRHVFVERVEQGGFGRGPGADVAVEVALDGAILQDHQLGVQDGAVVFADQLRDALAEADDLLAGFLQRRVQAAPFVFRVRALARHGLAPFVEVARDIGVADADAGAEGRPTQD